MRFTCEICGYQTDHPLTDDTIIGLRGYWWHIPCGPLAYDEYGNAYLTEFPAKGKMIPETILADFDHKD